MVREASGAETNKRFSTTFSIMKLKLACALLGAAIVVVVAFAARQRTLNELRTGNESLRRRFDSQAAVPAPNPSAAVQPTHSVPPLSEDERSELLKLRGQFAPLQRELAEASNRVATLNQPKPQRTGASPANDPTSPPPVPKMQAAERNEDAKRLAAVLGKYLTDHSGELPDDLGKLEALASPALPAGTGQRFELMRAGVVPEEARSYTLAAREKQPQQLSLGDNGLWTRIYLRADGSIITVNGYGYSPNWSAAERNEEASARRDALR